MGRGNDIARRLKEIQQEVLMLGGFSAVAAAIERWKSDAQAALFHLNDEGHRPTIALLGGTGTGKSTMVNRLVEAGVSATSFRRTFTSGAVAVTSRAENIPEDWLGVAHRPVGSENLPARGEGNVLVIAPVRHPLTDVLTVVDTPDLDGDQPAHYAEADRAFRWADAVLFLVTPEKYQMTELLAYYRLARRYAVAAVFAMNKVEELAVVQDYQRQLAGREWPAAKVYVVGRDDAAFEADPETSLAALRQEMLQLPAVLAKNADARERGLRRRVEDVLGRARDQIVHPLLERRIEIERVGSALRSLTTVEPGVDVSPITSQLQRRLREQSILYLMGPQRMLDRVRQAPRLLMRLPRTAWDFLRGDPLDLSLQERTPQTKSPDFPELLSDQFKMLHSRIDDLLAATPYAQSSVTAVSSGGTEAADPLANVKLPLVDAARIAEEELADLKAWLEQRWNKTPRDTRIVQKMLEYLPGGKSLTKWSEAAPYLLAVVVAAHHASGIPIDLIVVGSFSLVTWIGEKISNEVTARTRLANRRISERFTDLSRKQIDRVCSWLEAQAPSREQLLRLQRHIDELADRVVAEGGAV